MKKYILSLIAVAICSLSISAQDLHTLDKELPCINKTFSVYFHVTLDSLRTTSWNVEAMEAEIAATNQYFAPSVLSLSSAKSILSKIGLGIHSVETTE